jgi:O-antigen/teichoic acid export membrane protein
MEKNGKDNQLKKNTIYSTLSLFFQSGYSAILGLTANIVLTILVSPKIFGIYITTLSIIAILNYFSDIGLAASLVQKKEITKEDITTTFTIQQLLIISSIIVGFLSTSFIIKFYGLPKEGIYLYWSLLLGFFLSSLKTIPSIFLERKVQFQKIVLVQIVENTVFYITVIIFALFHYQLLSFAYAVIARSIIGLILMYSLSFWIPSLGISKHNLKQLLSFGIPFQANSFLALFKDDLLILYLGKAIGFEGLGYIGWAKKWAEAPIRIVMDNINKVLFPVIARIQHDAQKVTRLIEKILFYQTLLLAPLILGMAILMNDFIIIIPKYSKWLPALPLFYIFCLSAFLSSYSTPFINLFNALGKVKVSFIFMIFWTVGTWIMVPIFIRYFGYFGFPITLAILSSSCVIVILKAKQYSSFKFFSSIYKPIISTIIMTCGIRLFLLFPIQIEAKFIISIITGAFIYYISLRLFKINVIREIKLLFHYE